MTKKKNEAAVPTTPPEQTPDATAAEHLGRFHLADQGLAEDNLAIDWTARAEDGGASLVELVRAEEEASVLGDELEARRLVVERDLAAARASRTAAEEDFARTSERVDWKRAEDAASEVGRLEAVLAQVGRLRADSDAKKEAATVAVCAFIQAATARAIVAKLALERNEERAAQGVAEALDLLLARIFEADDAAAHLERLRTVALANAAAAGVSLPTWPLSPSETIFGAVRAAAVEPAVELLLLERLRLVDVTAARDAADAVAFLQSIRGQFMIPDDRLAQLNRILRRTLPEPATLEARSEAPADVDALALTVRNRPRFVIDVSPERAAERARRLRSDELRAARARFVEDARKRSAEARETHAIKAEEIRAVVHQRVLEDVTKQRRLSPAAAEAAAKHASEAAVAEFMQAGPRVLNRGVFIHYPADLCDESVPADHQRPAGFDPVWPDGRPRLDVTESVPRIVVEKAIQAAKDRAAAARDPQFHKAPTATT